MRTASLVSEYRASPLNKENAVRTAYASVAGGTDTSPALSGNTIWCATYKSIQRPRTERDSATSSGVTKG